MSNPDLIDQCKRKGFLQWVKEEEGEDKPQDQQISIRGLLSWCNKSFGWSAMVLAVVDLASMRDAMKNLGSDPDKINPLLIEMKMMWRTTVPPRELRGQKSTAVLTALPLCTALPADSAVAYSSDDLLMCLATAYSGNGATLPAGDFSRRCVVNMCAARCWTPPPGITFHQPPLVESPPKHNSIDGGHEFITDENNGSNLVKLLNLDNMVGLGNGVPHPHLNLVKPGDF
ncbi:unnamed protein product [Fraxinus pennsylvanica]|uniref:Uncharacterized protein n=1 Tax=Fraxinus pennsylvanica TaxID=56036 RepID=A0AAD1ZJX0_9LAMI|nr:unnamed protein product [Fraxinus pennsylvanica]